MLVNLLREGVVFWAEVKVSFRLGDPFMGDQYFAERNDMGGVSPPTFGKTCIIIILLASDLYKV